MNKSILVFLVAILFSCGEQSRYNDYQVNGIKVKIDKRLSTNKKKQIIRTVEQDLSPEGAFYIKNLAEISYDSVLYSYLITLSSTDSINPTKLHLMKAYTEFVSNEILDKRPVHMFVSHTGQYIEYDTTVLVRYVGNASEWGRLRLETESVENYLNSRIAKILEKSLRQVKFDGPLIGQLRVDSTVYTVDFVLDPSKHNAVQFRDSIGAIDPYHKFLILDQKDLIVHFKDSTGRKLAGSVHFP